ncbi:MAG: hypothetical protein FJ292_09790, partial [Planctomycetes bacterium]|nr:hypothetical protein [Planctomycetota bacterium]
AMSFSLREQANHREGTGRVNAAVRKILEERGPTSALGTKAKVFYVSQIAVNPPTIAMVVNKPAMFEGRYERYFLNRLREELPFSEVPIKLQFSARRRWQDGEGGGSPDAPAEAPVRERSEPRARGGREERSPRGPRGASRRQPAGARNAGAKRAGKKPARTGRSGPGKRSSR